MQSLLQLNSNKYYIFLMCVCSFMYPAYNARAQYCHLWPARLYNIFLHYLINDTNFKKKNTENNFIFCATFVWNILHSEKKWAGYYKKCIVLHVKYPLFLSDFNTNLIFSKDFRKILEYQISWKPVQWGPRCSMRTDGRTDGHDEANRRFSQYYERA
jgi:hypothetical protein